VLALDVPRRGRVDVEVLDLAGRLVAALHHGAAEPGTLRLRWDGADASGRAVPPGLYFAQARQDGRATRTTIVRVR
jgi:flagellar hook assembly protein FlgD